jgi:hypothetical protein
MTSNAATWFYSEPEHNPYLIAERLNGTFWQARLVGVYWRVVNAEAPFRALGYAGKHILEMEWVPGQWLALKVPAQAIQDGLATGTGTEELVENISKRVLAMPASISYGDSDGSKIYEWHMDGGAHRWSELQGKPGFMQPKRLKSK